jgi:dienelactone hydrolase
MQAHTDSGRRPRSVLRVLAPAFAVAIAATPAPAFASTVHFPFRDHDYLVGSQKEGGTAFVPHAALDSSDPVPLVVFLHGINPGRQIHLWMRGDHDLRRLAEQLSAEDDVDPFVLAAPSQTRAASRGKELWPNLDVDAFVADAIDAVQDQVQVDSDRIYVVGHSGAGCNPNGGLAAVATAHAQVRGVMAIDTCLDEDSGGAFSKLAPSLRLWVAWQSRTWWRDVTTFRRALGSLHTRVRIQQLDVAGPTPHEAIVPQAFTRMAHTWLHADAARPTPVAPPTTTSHTAGETT